MRRNPSSVSALGLFLWSSYGPAQQPFGNKLLAEKAETRRWAAWRCGSPT